MFGFKYSKNTASDYKNLLDVYAELGKHRFEDLSNSDKDELLAAWMCDEDNKDERLELFLDFVNSNALSEMMYGSRNHSPEKIGLMLYKIIKNGPQINSINEDLAESFTDYVTSLKDYEGQDDELRYGDNIERAKSVRMGV